MIIAMLGVLKAGGVYVPFNTGYPPGRLKAMIADSGISYVVYSGEWMEGLEVVGIKVSESLYCSRLSTGIRLQAEGLCVYYVYLWDDRSAQGDSGESLEYYPSWYMRQGEIRVRPEDRMLQWSNYAFDGSVYEIYCSFLERSGIVFDQGSVGIGCGNVIGGDQKAEAITMCFITTALFNALVDTCPGVLQQVRKILFGGEKVSWRHVKKALSIAGPGKIVHVYGPTETTVYASYYPVEEMREDGVVPIGRPLSNTKLMILDEHGRLVPVGVPGELYIGERSGDGVCAGGSDGGEVYSRPVQRGCGIGVFSDGGGGLAAVPDGGYSPVAGRWVHRVYRAER